MIQFHEALDIVLHNARQMKPIKGPFDQEVLHVIAEDIHSVCNMPPFNKSAVDGFACKREDLGLADKNIIPDPLIVERSETSDPLIVERSETPDPLIVERSETSDPLIVERSETSDPLIVERSETPDPLIVELSETPDPLIGRPTGGLLSAERSEALTVVETIAAGQTPTKTIGPGQCARIMTGAMVPEGADTVIMVEHTEEIAPNKIRFTGNKTSTNICYLSEDIREGEKVLSKGTLITPDVMAVLAATAPTEIDLFPSPTVSVISTGDELVPLDEIPSGAHIRDSNSYQLYSWLQMLRFPAINFKSVPDQKEALLDQLNKALDVSDVVLLSGGVSMGDFDFVPEVMQAAGVEILFKSVAIQPGRPTVFGKVKHYPGGEKDDVDNDEARKSQTIGKVPSNRDKFVFGLPGNPVSSFVLFEMLVKPFLYKMMGHDYQPLVLPLPMGETYTRKRSNRKNILPVDIRGGKIYPVPYHGSAHIHAYTHAKGMIALEIGTTEIKEGTITDVRFL